MLPGPKKPTSFETELKEVFIPEDTYRKSLVEGGGVIGMIFGLFRPIVHGGQFRGYHIAIDVDSPVRLPPPFKRRKAESKKRNIHHRKALVVGARFAIHEKNRAARRLSEREAFLAAVS